jgi:hypothetical protein
MKTANRQVILLRLRELAQLFNSMDPSPFVDRDLDADAEEFIMSWARELAAGEELELVIHLASVPAADPTQDVQDSVRRYFESRAAIKRLEFGQLLRRGRLSLGVGLLFLAACLGLGGFVARAGFGTISTFIEEGLTIVGWVAMWRPLEIYLYDWWPLFEERRRLDRLARIRVRFVVADTPPAAWEAPGPDRPELEQAAA